MQKAVSARKSLDREHKKKLTGFYSQAMDNDIHRPNEWESQGSWTPATAFRSILPKPVPIYVNGEAHQPNQANWQGSECFSSVCSQYQQSNSTFLCFNSGTCMDMSRHVTNCEVCSTGQMSIDCDNVEGRRGITVDPLAEWKNVPFGSLLALANGASQRKDSEPTDEVSISHHHSYYLNFQPGAMQNQASYMTTPEFAPITPDKAIRVKTKQFSELENSCTDDRTKHDRDGEDDKIAQERADSKGIQHSKQHLEPVIEALVSAVSTQIKENPDAENVGSNGLDHNRTPQQKPRKKHRPKVVKEGNSGTPRTGSNGNPTVKRKYVRKKGLIKDLKSPPAEAGGESINQNTPEPTMEKCRKTVNFDVGLTRDENSSMQICEGSEVMIPKPLGSKANPTKKRKYVRKKGTDKERSPSREAAAAVIDMKTLKPTKESCMPFNFDVKEPPRDENSTCKSTLDLVLESQAKDFCPSKLTVQLVKEIEARSPKSVTPQSKENKTGKRKYVRKKGLNKDSTSTPVEAAGESNDLKTLGPTKKSCRRTLNFDVEGQPRDKNSMSKSSVGLDSESQRKDIYRTETQSKSIIQLGQGIEVIVENTQAGIAYDLTRPVNQVIKDYISSPEGQAPGTSPPTKTNPWRQKQNADSRKENKSERQGQENVDNGEGNTKEIVLQINSQSSPKSLNDSKCSAFSVSIEQGQAWGLKRNYSEAIKQAETGRLNLIGIHYHTLQAGQKPGPHFPNIYKKKRTEKGQNSSTSCTLSPVTAAKNITLEPTCFQGEASADSTESGTQERQKILEGILALSPVETLTKKRSRGLTQVQDLASMTRYAECTMQQTDPDSQGPLDCEKLLVENPQRPQTCIEALLAEMHEMLARKKRSKKRNTLLRSTSSNTNGAQKQQKIISNNHNLFSSNSLGTLSELTWKQMFNIDTIIERLKNLDINRETSCIKYQEQNALVPYYMVNQEHNALVLYSRDGRLVPFQGPFDPIKKRRSRPKVELDEESNRVWKLLMQNINSEGIDGTDEENAKWWEEERRVFHGRVNSFIARMHLVQGDRRFSQWKGSVVDSVVGVFLTQNVSDHLSSSAFMSLAANFPLKSENKKPNVVEETSSVIDIPVEYIIDLEDTIEWKGKTSHIPVCDQSSMTLHGAEHNEEKEVVSSNDSLENSTGGVSSINESKSKLMNSCESSPGTYDDALSSQNSMDSSIAQHADRTRSSSNSSSAEAEDLIKLNSLNGSGSFVELLQMVGSTTLHEVYVHKNVNIPFNENSKDDHKQFHIMKYDNQIEKVEDLDGSKEFLQVSGIPPSIFPPCLTKDLAVEVECYEMSREETRSSGVSENVKNTVTDQITLTEFANQTTYATKLTVPGLEAPRHENKQLSNMMQEDKNMTAQHQSELFGDSTYAMGSLAYAQKSEMQQHLHLKKLFKETIDAVESRIGFGNQENTRQKTSVSDWNKHDNSFGKELNEINDATLKPKSRRAGKEKQNDFDWDSLRRQVEANGTKNKRPENTLDSLDWEAVRCADVNKIANTIKERGMNNILAERIKDFLNRLVRDHGSIDLEWLREVPPDKAKEYLLSIRGLGLKSVECVRLLTLHHLAFPVDTNVGRIAVRLGWVPLQPLPESLQLHLLELYPVLESIQKYLWPRLCKLDQRTLYELHYQMITFGKVFCTKSKPNCNACPMRGECKHFASAFASSRLALPGMEEKTIVHAKENRTTDQTPAVTINQIPLPLPEANKLSVGHHQSEAGTVLNNCEPIIEEPATPEPECIQVSENDIEDAFFEDSDEIPTIKLNMKEFTRTLQNYMQDNLELQEGDMSKALVSLTTEVASIPTPKLKNVSRLRTEHHVYELPDSHPLLEGLDKREPDDPGRYMLAIWTPGETANSIQPPERRCSSQEHGKLCDEKTCFSCNSVRESESQIVRGTLLIPCRTAMRGSFPLNGTYFQVNEVFADHDSSLKPINVPREWLWNLPRRTVYFGTSIPTIFKGLTTEGIQHCFWRGYVCVRGFDHKTRAPRPLIARLHFPASKVSKVPGKTDADDK